MKLYKIRHKETGLFSTGGVRPSYSKIGKTWNSMTHVKSHLKQYDTMIHQYPDYIKNTEIVTYELKEVNTSNTSQAIKFCQHTHWKIIEGYHGYRAKECLDCGAYLGDV